MDFLFEESLLENMEIVSFEERTPDEIMRENAHYMLDIEMDFQEIMEEDYVETVTEGFAGTVMEKIKAVFRKIKEYISKFIEWVKNLFKKKDAAANSDSKSEEPKNNSGSTKSNSKQDANKNDDNKSSNDKKEEPKNNSSSNSNHTTKPETEPDVITEVKLLDASKLKSVFNKALTEMNTTLKGKKYNSGDISKDISELRSYCDKASSDAIKEIDNSCWVNARLGDVVKEVGGKKQYYSVNKEILDFLEHTASEVERVEKDFEALVNNAQRDNLSETEAAQLVTASKYITASIIKIVAHIKTCYNTDMNNRQTLMVQLKRKNRKGR